MAMVVAACGGSDESSSGGGGGGGKAGSADIQAALKKPTTVTLWAWTPGTQEAVNMFEKAHPNVTVKYANVGQGGPHYRKLRTVIKSGKGQPDVVQMEFQYIPSYTVTNDLLDMTPYLPADFLTKYPDWIAKQINVSGGIYGVPWDTGPLGFIYRKDLLEKAGITSPPKTWQEFADDARKYHAANPDSYFVNFAPNQIGQLLGFAWQAGARPFSGNAENLKINLLDPKLKEVVQYWDKLIADKVVSTDTDFTNQWYQGFSQGKYAGWLSAAWGPIFLQDIAKNTSGKWQAATMPQWNAGDNVSGNWGGSTLAVLKSTKNPEVASELARWLLQEKEPSNYFALDRFLFPPLKSTLKEPEWVDQKNKFYGGQQVNKVYAKISSTVDTGWQWDPIHEYVNTQGNQILSGAVSKGQSMESVLPQWQDSVVNYAKQQGINVNGG